MRAIFQRHRSDLLLVVIAVESTFVMHEVVNVSGSRVELQSNQTPRWDCSKYLDDPSGIRLFEEILRRTHEFFNDLKQTPDGLAISVPGTVERDSTIIRSTRLGILDPIDVSTIFKRGNTPPCFVFHDAECMGVGEAIHGGLKGINLGPENHYNFDYIFIDEGVGSTLFIDGKAYKGNGAAGQLGRLVLDPMGEYNPTFSSRGSLEVFASRPWVSSNIVCQFLAEEDKQIDWSEGSGSFRSAVRIASEKKERWNTLTYPILAEGWHTRDPIVVPVIDDAAKYLGLAMNCIITIVNPLAIVLGGGVIENLPGFYETVVSYARRFSWRTAWNRTIIRRATLDRSAQILGAAEMLRRVIVSNIRSSK